MSRIFARARRSPLVSVLLVLAVMFVLGTMPVHARAADERGDGAAQAAGSSSRAASGSSSTAAMPEEPSLPTDLAAPPPVSIGTQPPRTLDPAEGSGIGNVALASAEPSTGVAHATIGFELPAARGSAQPHLSLSYSSVAGVGEAGHGWAMDLPKLERRNPSNAPRYQDPATGEAIDPQVQDLFELSGTRLVPICLIRSGQCTNGTALPPREELPQDILGSGGWMYFRPEHDSGFSRVFWSPQHDTWIVTDRAGGSLTFGVPLDDASDDGPVDRHGSPGTSPRPIFRWNLSRQQDSSGNVVVYDWHKFPKPSGGETDDLGYLTDTFDTVEASGSGGGIARSRFAHHARLAYVQRDKVGDSGIPVFRRRRTWFLDHVDVTSRDFASASPRRLLRRYSLYPFARGEFGFQARTMLQNVYMSPACTIEEDGDHKLPDSIEGVCGSDSRAVARMSYSGRAPVPAVRGQFSFPHLPYEKITFLDVDGDGKADAVKTLGPTDRVVARLTSRSADPLLDMHFETGEIFGAPHLLFNDAILGDWLKDGRLNALALRFDQSGDDPQFGAFTPFTPPTGLLGTWKGGRALGRLSQWTGGPRTPARGRVDTSHYVDLDGDGYLDRFLARPIVEDLGAGNSRVIGYDYLSFLTTVDLSGRVFPFSRVVKYDLEEKELREPPYQDDFYELIEDELRESWENGIPNLYRTYQNIETGKVRRCSWRGNGDGSFGTARCGDPAQFFQSRGYRHDINADNLTDGVTIEDGKIRVLVPDGSGGFLLDTRIEATTDDTSTIQFADIDGSGVNSILLISKNLPDIQYFTIPSVSDNTRPGLLTSISNDVGATTEITYQRNTDTKSIPVALHAVKEIRTRNASGIDLDINQTGGPYVTAYTYRDPVYDARERRFRGYRFVTETQHSRNSFESVVTETRFFIPDCEGRNLPREQCEPDLPGGRFEAAGGRPSVIERRDANGRTLSTTHYQYRINKLFDGMDGREVLTGHADRIDTWLYDPAAGTGHSEDVVLSDVIVEGLGQPLTRTYKLAGDHSTAMAHLAAETQLDKVGNVISKTDYGTVDGGPGIATDSPIVETFEWEIAPGDASRSMWRTRDAYVGSGAGRRRSHFEYDSRGRLTKTFVDLKGTLPLVRFHEDTSAEVAPTPLDASQDRDNVLLSEIEYDAWGNTTRTQGPNGRCVRMSYDALFQQLPTSQTVHTNGCGGAGLTTITAFDRGFALPTMTVDPNGAVSTVQYDAYGRPLRLFAPDPNIVGVPQSEPSAKMTYTDLPYRKVEVETRDDDGTSGVRYRKSWSYFDPYGHTLATVREADPGDPAPYIVSGQAQHDGLGRLWTTYQPHFATEPPGDRPPALPASGVGERRILFDSFSRPENTYGLDGRHTSHVAYHALSQDLFDAADLQSGATPHPTTKVRDGHGRTTLTRRATHQGTSVDVMTTQVSYLPTGEVAAITRSHSGGGDSYTRTMRYDSFGRLVENAEPNTASDFGGSAMKAWRYAYNDAGDLVGTSDARGCGRNSQWDGAGRLVAETFSPCLKTHVEYADRPAARWIYDQPEAGQAGNAYLGRLAAVYDRAQHSQYFYDARGRRTRVKRQIAIPNDDLDPVTEYAPHWFEREVAYDEADRVIGQSTGADVEQLLGTPTTVGSLTGRSVVTTSYSRRGRTERVAGSYGDLIKSSVADADGLLRSRTYGDTAETVATYEYNERRLLQRARLTRSSKAPTILQDLLIYQYDAAENPTFIGDGRIAEEWPDGAKPVHRGLHYDDLDQLRKVDYAFPNGDDKQVSPFEAEADARDRTPIPEQEIANRVRWQSFDYDWQGNLRGSDDDAHAFFDRSMGSATHGSATNGPNRVVSAALADGQVDAIYDVAGNLSRMLVKKKDSHGDDVNLLFTYEWDEIGQLVRARRLSKNEIPLIDILGILVLKLDLSGIFGSGVDLRYTYDSGGQRVVKTGRNVRSLERRHSIEVFGSLRLNHARFDDDDYERTEETETAYLVSNGSAIARVLYNEGLPQGADGSARHVFFTFTDALGSTSVVIDKATGELVERTTYLAYGQAESDYRPERWESFREDYRFTGKEDDVGVGLTYFGARYYVAAVGQWASADPLTIHQLGSDANPYAYVLGSPQKLVDPTGLLQSTDPCALGWCNFLSASATHAGGGAAGGGGSSFWKEGPHGGIPADEHIPEWAVTTFRDATIQFYKRTELSYLFISDRDEDCAGNPGCEGVTVNPYVHAGWLWEPIGAEEATAIIVANDQFARAFASSETARRDHPLQAPLIDPIDIAAGGITGAGKAAVRGIANGALRGLLSDTTGAIGSGAARSGGKKTVQQAAAELAKRAGHNRVSARTAGGKQVDIDLQGKGHFDKPSGQMVNTPHVHESQVHVGPGGTSLSGKTTRAATMDDVRTARKILER